MIKGIDVARYEPVIDWQLVKQDGYRFAFIKCSQADFNDRLFAEHWKNAKAAGMPRGAYHLYDPSVSPKVQAERFFNALHGDFGELPFVLDIEIFITGPYHGSQNWYNFIVELSKLSGNFPLIIYTGFYYWKDHVHDVPAVQDINYFGNYPLWIAAYETLHPLIPLPWTNWLFWQYAENGIVNGITDQLGRPTMCDLDYFFGSEEQFQVLLSSIPQSGEEMTSTFYRATGNITVRTGPATSFPQVSTGEQYVLTGDIVESDILPQSGFVKIINLYRNDVAEVMADPAWAGAAYLQPTTYTPPVPPTTDDVIKIYVNDVLKIYMIGKLQDL